MKTRWMGLALLAGWLGAMAPAWGQAPVPEPIPLAPAMTAAPAGGAPGPLHPKAVPPGPGSDLVLPASIPGAFTDNPPDEETGTYFHLGVLGLQRQRTGHFPLAVIDHNNPTNLDTGAVPLAARFTRLVEDANDINPEMGGGVGGTIGYLWGGNALEFTGSYVFDHSSAVDVIRPGRIDAFFTHPPLGFEGDNGLWLQADRMKTTLHEALGNAEFNYRWWNQGITTAEGILGVRYTDMNERLSVFTDDDGITIRDINGNPDPTRQATYQSRSHNHIVAGQLGFEWHVPMFSWVSFSWMGKGAWGANFLEQENILTRGDGLLGRAARRHETFFSHIYETGFYLDFWLLERARLRAGYNLLLLANVADAVEQVNFDLAHQASQRIKMGNVFYGGPLVELQLLF